MESTQLMILGTGPAGTSAAIYAGRAGMDTVMLGCAPKFAGDYEIDNYYGFPETISGRELQERGLKQAQRFGVEAVCDRVLGVHFGDNGKFVASTESGRHFSACGLVLATGVSRLRPGITNLDDYEGKGVSYCVSCDGFFFRNRPVVVAGEGIFAANQALELLQFTKDVKIVLQGKKSTITPEFMERLEQADIKVVDGKIDRLQGDNGLEHAMLSDGTALDAHGLFIAMGQASGNDFAYTLGLERRGVFIKADENQCTNIPGVFAAGDCTGGFLQIAVAVGEGAKAAKSAISWLKKQCPK
jgi:thioredoxin reductase (NADPH)